MKRTVAAALDDWLRAPDRKRKPLKSLLLGMPAVGEDADFARGQSRARAVRL